MKKFLLVILISFVGSINHSFAGTESGNGGDGILIKGKLYLLDLVEAGIEENPYFDSNVLVEAYFKKGIDEALAASSFPNQLIISKLSEVSKIDPIFARNILFAIQNFRWSLVSSELINIPDEDSVLPTKDMRQLAIRKDRSILIDRLLWNQLDTANKVALIFHEAIYAIQVPEADPAVKGTFRQSSSIARQLTSYLFTELLKKKGIKGLNAAGMNRYYILFEEIYYDKIIESTSGEEMLYKSFYYGPRLGLAHQYSELYFSFYNVPKPLDEKNLNIFCNSSDKPSVALFQDAYATDMWIKEFKNRYGRNINYVKSASAQDNLEKEFVQFKSVQDCRNNISSLIVRKHQKLKTDFDQEFAEQ